MLRIVSLCALGWLLGCGPDAAHAAAPSADGRNPAPAAAARSVLLELYTSQGCSSCPPADSLLAELDEDPALDVVPLAFHVDYWDDLGWKDPYASRRWTRRQRAFSAATGSRRVYTPQLLIDGRDRRTGHSEARARQAIAAAGSVPSTVVFYVASQPHDGSVTVDVAVEQSPPEAADVWVALYEDGIVTDVPRGENAGRTLQHDGVVRQLRRACSLDPAAAPPDCSTDLDASRLGTGKGGVAVFVQSATGPRILGATRAQLSLQR